MNSEIPNQIISGILYSIAGIAVFLGSAIVLYSVANAFGVYNLSFNAAVGIVVITLLGTMSKWIISFLFKSLYVLNTNLSLLLLVVYIIGAYLSFHWLSRLVLLFTHHV